MIFRIIAMIAGGILILSGGVSFGMTTVPGVALVIWGITGYGFKG